MMKVFILKLERFATAKLLSFSNAVHEQSNIFAFSFRVDINGKVTFQTKIAMQINNLYSINNVQ